LGLSGGELFMPRIQPLLNEANPAGEEVSYLQSFTEAVSFFSKQDRLHQWHDTVGSALVASQDAAEVIDIGCDIGESSKHLSEYIKGRGLVHGVDANSIFISIASQRQPDNRLQFSSGHLDQLDYNNDVFDLVYLERILHVSDDYASILKEAKRVLKPQAVLAICEPDFSRLQCDFVSDAQLDILRNIFIERTVVSELPKNIEQNITGLGLDMFEQNTFDLIIDDFARFDSLFSISTMLALGGVDADAEEAAMDKLNSAAQAGEFKITIPMFTCFVKK
tara:strand:+ start:852 stop:1685 length:834 start_codon:yes stop_codon:yes gene_type:complete